MILLFSSPCLTHLSCFSDCGKPKSEWCKYSNCYLIVYSFVNLVASSVLTFWFLPPGGLWDDKREEFNCMIAMLALWNLNDSVILTVYQSWLSSGKINWDFQFFNACSLQPRMMILTIMWSLLVAMWILLQLKNHGTKKWKKQGRMEKL